MSALKPTLVFVHGAFHSPDCFSDLTTLLKRKGYLCIDDLQLPSTGGPSNAAPGLEDSATFLRKAVNEVIDGTGRFARVGANDCIVIMHSWGGAVGAQGLEGLGVKSRPGKKAVTKLVFICANVPAPGDSLASQVQNFVESYGSGGISEYLEVDGENIKFIGAKSTFYNDLPEQVQDDMMNRLMPHSLSSITTPVTGAAYREIPSWYLLGEKDICVIPALQEHICETHKAYFEKVIRVDGGHSCFVSKPQEVGNIIEAAVSVVLTTMPQPAPRHDVNL